MSLIIIRPIANHWWVIRQITPSARPPVVQPVADWSLTKFWSTGWRWLLVIARFLVAASCKGSVTGPQMHRLLLIDISTSSPWTVMLSWLQHTYSRPLFQPAILIK